MKKALVLSLLAVFAIGAAVLADGTFTGSWNTQIGFNLAGPNVQVASFNSTLKVDYTLSGWDFGTVAMFTNTSFPNLFFSATGTLGAFSLYSVVDFNPAIPAFHSWVNFGEVSIAGVTMFGIWDTYNFDGATPNIGTGVTLGAQATMGDVKVLGLAFFNMVDSSIYYYYYGVDYIKGRIAYVSTCTGAWYNPYTSFIAVQTAGCTLGWTGADIYVDIPFCCLDVGAYLTMSCANGFNGFGFMITNIQSGISWLNLDEVDIDFTINSKAVSTYFSLNLGDIACVKPYFSVDGTGTQIQGITLNALMLSCTIGNVKFIAGEIFDNTWASQLNGTSYTWGFKVDGTLTNSGSCIYKPWYYENGEYYNEMAGVSLNTDGCCGGAFKASVIAFFDTSSSAPVTIFGWKELVATASIGIGSNVSLSVGASFEVPTGLHLFNLGVTFSW